MDENQVYAMECLICPATGIYENLSTHEYIAIAVHPDTGERHEMGRCAMEAEASYVAAWRSEVWRNLIRLSGGPIGPDK